MINQERHTSDSAFILQATSRLEAFYFSALYLNPFISTFKFEEVRVEFGIIGWLIGFCVVLL